MIEGRFSLAARLGVAAMLSLSCNSGNDVLVGYNRGNAEGGRAGPAAAAGSSGLNGGGMGANAGQASGGASDFCSNGGPSIELPSLGGCTGDLAKRVFLFAICTCGDLWSTGTIATDSVDSRAAMTLADPDLGGSVGVNGVYRAEGLGSQLGGSLWVRGDAEFGQHDVAGDLQCGGSLTVTDSSRIRGDAYVSGDVAAPSLTIDGTLNMPGSSARDVLSVQGGMVDAAVSVPPPCDCQEPLDIAAIASHFQSNNDNATVNLVSSAFTEAQGDVELSLPCGRYYLDSLGGTAAITLHLTGRTALAVGEGLSNSGGLSLELGPDAELDLFVGGGLELSGPGILGSSTRPAATRIYVDGQVALSSNLSAYANWYVPNHPFVMSTRSEFWGAIYAQSLQVSGSLAVHYDRAVLDASSCTPSGEACNSCRDCANPTPACRNGGCEACQADSDCCPPLHCSDGLCEIEPEVF